MKKQIWHDQHGNEIDSPLGPDGIPTHSKVKDAIDAKRKPLLRPPGKKK